MMASIKSLLLLGMLHLASTADSDTMNADIASQLDATIHKDKSKRVFRRIPSENITEH
jgi:hypothetical protein